MIAAIPALGITAAKAGLGALAAKGAGAAALPVLGSLGKSALLSGAGTALGALPDIIPSRYERDQKKRLREMQRKQEMGMLGLTDRERAQIESQMRGTRQQAQQFADAERARLTQPSAQPQMALLGQQMADESRQRLEADLASQILGMDLTRQAQQEQEIKDLEAAQAQYRRARAEGLVAPAQSAAETAASQIALERLLGNFAQQQVQQAGQVAAAQETGKAIAQAALSTPQGQQALQTTIGPALGFTPEQTAMFESINSYAPTAMPAIPSQMSMAEETYAPMQTKQSDTIEQLVQDILQGYR
jgi:hypothetical protein